MKTKSSKLQTLERNLSTFKEQRQQSLVTTPATIPTFRLIPDEVLVLYLPTLESFKVQGERNPTFTRDDLVGILSWRLTERYNELLANRELPRPWLNHPPMVHYRLDEDDSEWLVVEINSIVFASFCF